jgi:hypothetical protein
MNSTLIETYNEIALSIKELGNRHPIETVNSYMKSELEMAFKASNSRKEFVSIVKKATGLTSSGVAKCKACQYYLEKFPA